MKDQVVAGKTQVVRPLLVEFHYHSSYRRIGAVQSHTHALNAVRVHRIGFLPRVRGRSGEGEHDTFRTGCPVNRGLDLAGQRDFDIDIRTVPLHLQLLHFRDCFRPGR